jgi:hypothetical protein
MSSRYVPMTRALYRARAVGRALPAIGFLVLMWFAAFSNGRVPFAAGAVAFALVVAWSLATRSRQSRASARIAAANAQTTALLAEGRLDEAAAATDATLDAARSVPPIHCILLVQRAQLFLREGDAQRSFALLDAVRASRWLDDARLAQGGASLASALAMTELARGNLDDAERWQREAHARIKKADEIQLLPLDALMDARRGRLAEAATRIDEAWDAAAESLAPRAVDLLRLVRAFVADASGESRDAGDADAAYLTAKWPELRAFVERRAGAVTAT